MSFVSFISTIFCFEKTIFSPKESRSDVAKFLIFQGFTYNFLGCLALFCPDLYFTFHLIPAFTTGTLEMAYFRAMGFCVFYIGLFYHFAGLADNIHFALCSVFTRIVFVPTLFGLYCASMGLPCMLAAFFAVADPAFGLLTYWVVKRSHRWVDIGIQNNEGIEINQASSPIH